MDAAHVVNCGLKNAPLKREKCNGNYKFKVDHWVELLVSLDMEQLEYFLTSENNDAVEMRTVSIFAFLTQQARENIVKTIYFN